MNFARIGDGPCYYRWNEICAGVCMPGNHEIDSKMGSKSKLQRAPMLQFLLKTFRFLNKPSPLLEHE